MTKKLAKLAPGRSRLFRSGVPLDAKTRASMEAGFNHDFSAVRVHLDNGVAGVARSFGARAFTIGRDIGFSEGEYRPDTPYGRKMLAHELAHVVQQSGNVGEPGFASDESGEGEAHAAAQAVVSGRSISIRPRAVWGAQLLKGDLPPEFYQEAMTGSESPEKVRALFAQRGIFYRGEARWVPVEDGGGYWHLSQSQVIARETGSLLNMRADVSGSPAKAAPSETTRPAVTKQMIEEKRDANYRAALKGARDALVDSVVDVALLGYPPGVEAVAGGYVRKLVHEAADEGAPTSDDPARNRELQENYEDGRTVFNIASVAAPSLPLGKLGAGLARIGRLRVLRKIRPRAAAILMRAMVATEEASIPVHTGGSVSGRAIPTLTTQARPSAGEIVKLETRVAVKRLEAVASETKRAGNPATAVADGLTEKVGMHAAAGVEERSRAQIPRGMSLHETYEPSSRAMHHPAASDTVPKQPAVDWVMGGHRSARTAHASKEGTIYAETWTGGSWIQNKRLWDQAPSTMSAAEAKLRGFATRPVEERAEAAVKVSLAKFEKALVSGGSRRTGKMVNGVAESLILRQPDELIVNIEVPEFASMTPEARAHLQSHVEEVLARDAPGQMLCGVPVRVQVVRTP